MCVQLPHHHFRIAPGFAPDFTGLPRQHSAPGLPVTLAVSPAPWASCPLTLGSFRALKQPQINKNQQPGCAEFAHTRTVKVSNVSSKATEREINEFFSFSGEIEQIAIESNGDAARKTVYVRFVNPEAVETAVLLSGATIVDEIVSITEFEDFLPSSFSDGEKQAAGAAGIGGAVTKAQDVFSTMLARGYDLGKDAVYKAKAFDEKHQLSANATATVSSFDQKMGLTQKLSTGTAVVNEHVKALDEKFQVSEKTRSAFVAAEEKMSTASSALMKNKIILSSAAWVTGAFSKVSKAAGEVGQRTLEKIHDTK
ncbi:hypothetical protein L7F22_046085 [Adiantum nelumboides]|nr:hypothetical protein [Adiantum nelumboides]